ncbi:MAG: hypothetical protein ACKO7B_20020, partial [Flavobacteriales bacterium]
MVLSLFTTTNPIRPLKTTLKHYSLVPFSEKAYFRHRNHIKMLVKTLGDAIKNRRKELDITQPHLAELAQISINTLYKLEKGQG